MSDRSEVVAPPPACRKCGGRRLGYSIVEHVKRTGDVIGLDADGLLITQGLGEHPIGHERRRLVCLGCSHEWPTDREQGDHYYFHDTTPVPPARTEES